MFCYRFIICVILILQLAVVPSTAGKEPAEKPGGEGRVDDTVCLELAGKKVRVRARDQEKIEGRVVGCVRDSLYLAGESGRRAVALDDVNALWVHSSAAKKGFASGAILGAVGGGVLGALAPGGFGNGGTEGGGESRAAAALGLGAFGALVGGLIGVGIGVLSSDWHLWYGSGEETAASISVLLHYVGSRSGPGVVITYRF